MDYDKKYIDAELLRAEIERRRLSNRYIDTDGYEAELFEIIASLQQEQHSLPSNLDEASKKIVIQLHPCMEYSSVLGDHLTMGELVELVKAGANWQQEQMLKDAVEGEVCKDHIVTEKPFYFYQSRLIELPDNLKEGDKVKIVIVKEDNK